MVVTSRKLQDNLGVNKKIADYFANERAVPQNNLFWKNKRIYLSVGFGFLTIPLTFDLIHKLGVPLDILLSDEHVTLMEEGFHQLKCYENETISFHEFLQQCKQLLSPYIKQKKLAADLFTTLSGGEPQYFQFEAKHKALARSDSFLFTLVDLDLSDLWVTNFLPYWYAVARPILLLDDFKDLQEDRRTNDENTIIELGNNKRAIEAAFELGMQDLEKLKSINPQLAKYMQYDLNDALLYDHIQAEIN